MILFDNRFLVLCIYLFICYTYTCHSHDRYFCTYFIIFYNPEITGGRNELSRSMFQEDHEMKESEDEEMHGYATCGVDSDEVEEEDEEEEDWDEPEPDFDGDKSYDAGELQVHVEASEASAAEPTGPPASMPPPPPPLAKPTPQFMKQATALANLSSAETATPIVAHRLRRRLKIVEAESPAETLGFMAPPSPRMDSIVTPPPPVPNPQPPPHFMAASMAMLDDPFLYDGLPASVPPPPPLGSMAPPAQMIASRGPPATLKAPMMASGAPSSQMIASMEPPPSLGFMAKPVPMMASMEPPTAFGSMAPPTAFGFMELSPPPPPKPQMIPMAPPPGGRGFAFSGGPPPLPPGQSLGRPRIPPPPPSCGQSVTFGKRGGSMPPPASQPSLLMNITGHSTLKAVRVLDLSHREDVSQTMPFDEECFFGGGGGGGGELKEDVPTVDAYLEADSLRSLRSSGIKIRGKRGKGMKISGKAVPVTRQEQEVDLDLGER